MRWPTLAARFEAWFAEAAAQGDTALADSLAGIRVSLPLAERWGTAGIKMLFDYLEQGESIAGPGPAPSLSILRDLADDFEAILRERGLWRGRSDGREAAIPYLVGTRR